MLKIFLDQKTIRLIFIPLNFIFLIIILITTCIPFQKIPTELYSTFVFWLFKPILLVEIVLTTCVLVMGFTGATKFNRCWQSSFTFFIFLLCIIGICTLSFCDDIRYSADTVIVNLQKEGQYTDIISQIFSDLDCQEWEDTNEAVGCHKKLLNAIGNYPDWARPYIISALTFLIIYFLINLFISLFVVLKEESANLIENE